MHKLLAVAALLATAPAAFGGAPAGAVGVSAPSGLVAAGGRDSMVVLVGGMGGGTGGGGGMSSGAGSGGYTGGMGGMNGGGTGGMSGAGTGRGTGGMNGGGDMFAGSGVGFAQPAPDPSASGGAYYTYQCVTPVGRCSFVAPAALRGNALRSGADCACPDGRSRGQVE